MAVPICAARPAAQFTRVLALAIALAGPADASASSGQEGTRPARNPPWPGRLIVKPTLLGVVVDGLERSPTLRGQCRELAGARSVVVLDWRESPDSQSRAVTRMGADSTGVVVARVSVPPVSHAIELVAHELEERHQRDVTTVCVARLRP